MRRLEGLSREELLDVVRQIVLQLYGEEDDQGTPIWNPHKEWRGADLLEAIAEFLAGYGLVPEAPGPMNVG